MKLRNPKALVSTQWLHDRLDDPGLRIFDCSTVLEFEEGGRRPYRVLDCRAEHEDGHIPGAGVFDLQGEFSEEDSPYGMTLSPPERVASAFERAGVDDGTQVVLYSRRSPSWSTRFWWMLRWLGFDNASILDGGFEKWVAEDRPLAKARCGYPRGRLTAKPREGLFVGKTDVLRAVGGDETCLVNALGPDVFSGENPRYGRPGRIPGSVNVPKTTLIDPKSGAFLAPEEIYEIFSRQNVIGADAHIAYCGGGIFATVIAFWLYQFGQKNVSVYDNSMSEWGPDDSLPIEAG